VEPPVGRPRAGICRRPILDGTTGFRCTACRGARPLSALCGASRPVRATRGDRGWRVCRVAVRVYAYGGANRARRSRRAGTELPSGSHSDSRQSGR
jgi:hypothetical protein